MTMMATATDVLEAVRAIPDPEIPVITIEGLGILRECRLDEAAGLVHVVITPTYSGCPAMRAIEDQIARVCRAHGLQAVVTTALSPAWSTDWITEDAREALRRFGIAPPGPVVAGDGERAPGPVSVMIGRGGLTAPAPGGGGRRRSGHRVASRRQRHPAPRPRTGSTPRRWLRPPRP